ncbi:MAG: hypothetical protein LIO37_01570, partial [Clostridiales bacterium]|nr:hypothetical protein [Clostridiales bacterium]
SSTTDSGTSGTTSSTADSGTSGTTSSTTDSGTSGSSTASTESTVTLSTPVISSVKNTKTGVTIKWGKVAGATGYTIYRCTSKNGDYDPIYVVNSGSTLSYTDDGNDSDGLTSGKRYYIRLRLIPMS